MDRLDNEIREEMERLAETYTPPVRLKAAIDARTVPRLQPEGGRTMQKKNMIKAAAIAAACVALSGTTVYGIGRAQGWYSYGTAGQYTTLEQVEKAAEKVGLSVDLPEEFSNGFRFVEGSQQTFGRMDDTGGHMDAYQGVDAFYENANGESLSVTVEPIVPGDGDAGEDLPVETREIAPGIVAEYNVHQYMVVPPDYEVPEEILEREKTDPKFWLSYGSDTVEENENQSLSFTLDGQRYLLMGNDLSLDADGMFAMAEEIVG